MSEVGAAVAATNAAANHFYNALRQEEAAVLRNMSLLHRGPSVAPTVFLQAPHFVSPACQLPQNMSPTAFSQDGGCV